MNQMIERVNCRFPVRWQWSRGGGEGGRERAGVEEEFVCRLKCSFEIFIKKVCGK